jgi:hypothetical protein
VDEWISAIKILYHPVMVCIDEHLPNDLSIIINPVRPCSHDVHLRMGIKELNLLLKPIWQ